MDLETTTETFASIKSSKCLRNTSNNIRTKGICIVKLQIVNLALMRTFELEADQLQSIDDVKHFLKEKEVREGDTLKLITEQTKMIYIVVVLAIVFAAIMSVMNRSQIPPPKAVAWGSSP